MRPWALNPDDELGGYGAEAVPEFHRTPPAGGDATAFGVN